MDQVRARVKGFRGPRVRFRGIVFSLVVFAGQILQLSAGPTSRRPQGGSITSLGDPADNSHVTVGSFSRAK